MKKRFHVGLGMDFGLLKFGKGGLLKWFKGMGFYVSKWAFRSKKFCKGPCQINDGFSLRIFHERFKTNLE